MVGWLVGWLVGSILFETTKYSTTFLAETFGFRQAFIGLYVAVVFIIFFLFRKDSRGGNSHQTFSQEFIDDFVHRQ